MAVNPISNLRKTLQGLVASNTEASLGLAPKRSTGVVDMANLVLRLLPSKEGVMLRRLLMTAVSALTLYDFPNVLDCFWCYIAIHTLV